MASTPHDALLPRQPGGMAPGAALAVLAHVGLLFALTAAVDWRLRKPDLTASAELWAAVPQAAAPRAAEPPPVPTPAPPPPAPPPPPPPTPAPTPAPPPPPAAQPAPQRADADIALERERREKQLMAEREKEQQARAQREQERRDQEAQKLAQKKREATEAESAKRLAEAETLKKKREADAKAEEARLAQQREENLKRMLGQAGGPTTPAGTGGPQATGTAATDAAPSASYAGKLVALIRPNIVFTGSAEANAAAEVEVRAGPSGTILSRRLVKASGQPDWDDAVLRAIDKTARLPRDTDGRIPQVIVMVFKPRE